MGRRSMFLQDLNGMAAPEEAVEQMLDAANWAPTHGLTQPWRFSVFRRSTGQIEEFFNLQMTASANMINNPQHIAPAEEKKALEKFMSKHPKKKKEIAKCSHVIAISMKRKGNPEKVMPEWEEIA